ncbi:MAG: TrkH family potassium uptake protein [Hyphomonas sp.]|uniref:TrkH family potassium uptake protein n=1 Tax=Hyphomonas sp. TaxID=87 RepID=UPI0035293D66
MQLRPLLLAIGIMTVLLGVAMLPCALIDWADKRPEAHVFAVSSFASIFFGSSVWVLSRGGAERTGQREGFLLTVMVWTVLPIIAAIPFMASGMSFTDAVFESVSGLTTTGSTVLSGLDSLPRGLLLWRAIIHWFGGIGIIVTAIAILPQLRVGGMQLFQLENSDRSGKFLPRVTDITAYLGLTYVIVSMACALTYYVCGMTWFDAICHAMATMSAGGFSTHDASFGYFNDTMAPWAGIVFMLIAGLPFSLMAMLVLQGRVMQFVTDPQPRLYFALAIVFSALISVFYFMNSSTLTDEGVAGTLKLTIFNTVAVMTGTGFATAPYDTWGTPIMAMILGITFVGGCAGSAACGLKIFRIEITAKALLAYSQRMVQPHRRSPIKYGGKTVDEDTLQSVMVFMFLYFATFLVSAALLGLDGLDPVTAISGAATTLSNVGPGLGPINGPSTTFQSFSDFATWVCTINMLLGRLEFVVVFVVLTRRFWRG